jgi:HK97 family phage major capsid protein
MTAPTLANPGTPGEWEDWLNTTLTTPEAFAAAVNSGEFKTKLTAYTSAQNKTMAELKNEMTEQVSASVLEMFKRNGAAEVTGRVDMTPANLRAERAGTAYNKGALGVQTEKIWNSAAQMVQDITTDPRRLGNDARARLDKYSEFTNAFSEGVPAEGGFLVPEIVRADIMTRALEQTIVRSQAVVVPMPTAKFKWPAVDFTTEVGEVFGGIAFSWLDEGQTIPATSGSFATIDLNAHRLGGRASVPNGILRHAPALEQWIRTAFPAGIGHFEDLGFMSGDGAKKPLGGLNAANPALIAVNAESGQPTNTITWNNVLAMYARLLPESYATAEWDISPDCIPQIFTMAVPVGVGGSAVMIGEGTGPQKLPQSILGIPIRWTRKTPGVLGTQGDISLNDWTKYIIGDTYSMSLDTSEHVDFNSDKTAFRIIEEVDGQPALLSALTPQNNGPTLSAFIQLATRP